MSGITLIEFGDSVPIDLLLSDGAIDQFPQVEIYDPDGNNLTTISLVHAGDGLYQPATPYTMPDEVHISVVAIVYTDVGHIIESAIYQRDIDVYRTIDADNYKATGFSVPNEYDVELAAIQAEVDNLDGEPMRGTDGVPINPLLDNDARLNNLDVLISSRSSHADPTAGIKGTPGKTVQEVFDNERGTNGANTVTPPTVGEINTELTTFHGGGSWAENDPQDISDTVWADTIRTLTSFGTLVADIWAYITRTLTAGTKDSEIDDILADTNELQNNQGNWLTATGFGSAGEYDVRLTAIQASLDTLQVLIYDLLGITGENVIWTGITHDANHNTTGATITQYEDETLVVARQAWVYTATYDAGNSELLTHQLTRVP